MPQIDDCISTIRRRTSSLIANLQDGCRKAEQGVTRTRTGLSPDKLLKVLNHQAHARQRMRHALTKLTDDDQCQVVHNPLFSFYPSIPPLCL